jgi:hypothetical protein
MVNYFYKVKEYFAIKGIKICKKRVRRIPIRRFWMGKLDESAIRKSHHPGRQIGLVQFLK